jgi:hypothetical protein
MSDPQSSRRRKVLMGLLVALAVCSLSSGLVRLTCPEVGFAVLVLEPALFLLMVLIAVAIWVNVFPAWFGAGPKAKSSKEQP